MGEEGGIGPSDVPEIVDEECWRGGGGGASPAHTPTLFIPSAAGRLVG